MRSMPLVQRGERLSVLCLGAHADDIEIGAGGTILGWIRSGVELRAHWCVLSATGDRAREAKRSAAAFLTGAAEQKVELATFADSYFPTEGAALKKWFERVKAESRPDIILTHRGDDAHQDHREVSRLTWNAFRDHLILEYEIPKWDGDLGRPNAYVALPAAILERKIEILMQEFGTQRSKDWFDPETFRGLARLRGMECRAHERYAEAFYVKKISLN